MQTILKHKFPKTLVIFALLPTLIIWWSLLIFLFDFQYVYILRTLLQKNSFWHRLDPLINESVDRISNSNIKFSKPLDIFFPTRLFYVSNLPRYGLEIKPSDINHLNKLASLAIKYNGGLLSDDYNIWVPATFSFSGDKVSAKIKLRGDRQTHWNGNKKSLKIKTKNETINLIIPEERSYIGAMLSKHIAQKLNLLSQEDKYINLSINERNLGTYYQTEQIDQNFLDKRSLPTGNVYSDRFGDSPLSYKIDLFSNQNDWKIMVIQANQAEDDVEELKALLDWIKQTESGTKTPNQLINQEQFLAWQIHTILIGNYTQDNMHNMKLYSNKNTGKLEPIVDDISFPLHIVALYDKCPGFDVSYNRLVDAMLKDPQILLKRNQGLWKYLNTSSTEDLSYIAKLKEKSYKDLAVGMHKSSNLQLLYAFYKIPRMLSFWHQYLTSELAPQPPQIYASQEGDRLKINVATTGSTAVKIDQVSIVNQDNNIIKGLSPNEDILPTLDKQTDQCLTYQQALVSYSLNCPDCQEKSIRVTGKYLINDQSFSQIIKI